MFSTLLSAYRRHLNDMEPESYSGAEQCLCRFVAGARVLSMIVCTAFGYVKNKANYYLSDVEHIGDGRRVVSYRNTCGNKFRVLLRPSSFSTGLDTYYYCLAYAHGGEEHGKNHKVHPTKCDLCTDITEHVHIYGGPKWDFHGTYITPRDLGYDHIFVEDLITGNTSIYGVDDKITAASTNI